MPTMYSPPGPSSSAAELVAGSEDLLRDILHRVPARDLIRLRAVSRRWLYLISDPGFRHRHASVRRDSSAVLLRPSPSSDNHLLILPLSLDLVSRDQGKRERSIGLDLPCARVVQSCNGLLLCCSRPNVGSSQHYYVFNPTTKQYSLLPELGVSRKGSRWAVFGLALAFDPSRSPFYKAVCVRGADASDYSYQIEVYSSKDREWRVCGSPFAAPFDMVFRDGVFWNGAVHWLSPSGGSLFFNVDLESLGEMPKPPDIALDGGERGNRRFRYFGHSGGHLHFFEIYGSTTAQFRVFEMKTDYSGWLLKFEVNLASMIQEFPETVREHHDSFMSTNYYAFSVLLLIQGDSDEEGSSTSVIIHVPGRVLSYNVCTKTIEEIYEIPPHQGNGYGRLHYGWLDAYEFTDTLAIV
ncbi:hypothetical protein MLD38_006456 [Melastoma candidum]|uniref:Uncharacterized protein n=1 Tax=Melastoma candidum TaxID=119954 RepID=A0ACB9RQZ0_9MYRT|nr:hypothetical protein MLD38_006456 [Melastoma candidum]